MPTTAPLLDIYLAHLSRHAPPASGRPAGARAPWPGGLRRVDFEPSGSTYTHDVRVTHRPSTPHPPPAAAAAAPPPPAGAPSLKLRRPHVSVGPPAPLVRLVARRLVGGFVGRGMCDGRSAAWQAVQAPSWSLSPWSRDQARRPAPRPRASPAAARAAPRSPPDRGRARRTRLLPGAKGRGEGGRGRDGGAAGLRHCDSRGRAAPYSCDCRLDAEIMESGSLDMLGITRTLPRFDCD